MGKKRRYINRAAKFGKKMFNFLDKVDGTQDSKLLSTKLDTAISKITLVDRGNQTFSIQCEGYGPGDSTTAGLEGDKVKYTVDGTAVHSNGTLTFAAAAGASANDRDNYVTNTPAPARAGSGASDVILTEGVHTIVATIYNEAGNTALSKEFKQEVHIDRARLGLAAAANFLAEGNNGDLTIDITKISAANDGLPGKQPGIEDVYSPKQTAGQRHGYKLVVKNSAGTALAIDGSGGTSLTVNQGAGVDSHANILDSAIVADDTLTVTFTPLDASNNPLTADEIEVSIAITV